MIGIPVYTTVECADGHGGQTTHQVEATDGYVGRVGEILIDAETGEITHLVLREGHLWGQ